MHHCMNKEELQQFLDFKTCGKQVDIDDLEIWIEDANNWQVELGCINYLLGQILLGKKKRNTSTCLSIIDLIYKLEDQLFFRIHECNHDFVSYMLKHTRQSALLEEELVRLHTRMREHNHERDLRH